MERILQYWDDLDDLIYGLALIWEKIRSIFNFVLFMLAYVVLQALGIVLAQINPPLALAMVSLLAVALLYRSAVYYGPPRSIAS